MSFDYAQFVNSDLPAAATAKWQGFPQYNFVGGHNDPDSLNIESLIEACVKALRQEGKTLATYGLESGPQGYLPLREFLVNKLKKYAEIECTTDNILLTSGSLQAIDLINSALVKPGDTVIVEESNYGGVLTRLKQLQVNMVPIKVDQDGMQTDHLAQALATLKSSGITPRYIYSIPTVHNPTGTIMTVQRRHALLQLASDYNVPVFEDECYADLVWENKRPPALMALDTTDRVVHIGTFSKTIAPALRVGYVVADWSLLSHLLSLKTDAGSGALEQMLLAEFCNRHFDEHLLQLNKNLQTKLNALTSAIDQEFGTTASYEAPPGGIFLWLKLPAAVDTAKLAVVAAQQGIALNPGHEWSLETDANHRLRLCFANPDVATIQQGVARLADICFTEFGVPAIGSNRQR